MTMHGVRVTQTTIFDVTMGSYDGAETCELVGTYMLSEISKIIPNTNNGLYQDDSLAIEHETSQNAQKIKKELCKKFREIGLKITANANVTITDFLDVIFDLRKKEYKLSPPQQHTSP